MLTRCQKLDLPVVKPHNANQRVALEQSGSAESADQLFYFLRRLHGNTEKLAEQLRFNKYDPNQACLISLYSSLLELSGAFLLLVEKNCHILIPSTLRSAVETYLEFENLRQNDAYLKDMEFYHLGQEVKILEAAKRGKNSFLSDISKLEDLDNLIKDHKIRRNELKKQNAQSYSITARFNKADLKDWHDGLYKFLSGNTHPSLCSIFYRQFARDENSLSILYGRTSQPVQMLPALDLMAGMLLDASKKIHEQYGGEKKATFKESEADLAEIRKKYSDRSDHKENAES